MCKKAGQKLFAYSWISAFFYLIKGKSYSKAWLNRNFVNDLAVLLQEVQQSYEAKFMKGP